jgi:hypothetical protein
MAAPLIDYTKEDQRSLGEHLSSKDVTYNTENCGWMTNDLSVWFFELEESLRRGRKMQFSLVDGLKIKEEIYKRNRGKRKLALKKLQLKCPSAIKTTMY